MVHASLRLQKFLAQQGIASRRGAAQLVNARRVTVNGEIATVPGLRVNPERDSITVDGQVIEVRFARPRTLMLYKPRGYVCSTRGQGAPTIYELLPDTGERLLPVGRLDKDSEGLLILTTDGALANRLMHPAFGHRKVYRVTVSGRVRPDVLRELQSPIEIDGRMTSPAEVVAVAGPERPGRACLRFTLTEVRNRQIRRLCHRSKLGILRLLRESFAGLQLGDLRPGQWSELRSDSSKLFPSREDNCVP